MRFVRKAVVAAIVAVLSGNAASQPMPPTNPQSAQECNEFNRRYKAYLDGLQDAYRACNHAHQSESTATWRPGYRCTRNVVVNVPAACVEPSNVWDCAGDQYGALLKQCSDAVRGKQREAARELDTSFGRVKNEIRKGATDTVAGRVGDYAAKQLAAWWVDNSGYGHRRELLEVVERWNNRVELARSIGAILDSSNPKEERIASLALLFNKHGNELSQTLTESAIKGVNAAHAASLQELDKAFTKFSTERSAHGTRALMQQRLMAAEEKASAADGNNARFLRVMDDAFAREIEEGLSRAQAERRAIAEERERLEREFQERQAAYERQRDWERAREAQRQYNQQIDYYNQAGSYIQSFISSMQQARQAGRSYGPPPVYRPPPPPAPVYRGGGGYPSCRGPGCAIR